MATGFQSIVGESKGNMVPCYPPKQCPSFDITHLCADGRRGAAPAHLHCPGAASYSMSAWQAIGIGRVRPCMTPVRVFIRMHSSGVLTENVDNSTWHQKAHKGARLAS